MDKPKILIVDDEPDILDVLEYNLLQNGFQVERAENGEYAVKIAKKFQPDLVILDIMMPTMDGVETCRQLRKMPETKHSYILFLTARSEEYSELAAFEVGADDYIHKPIKPRTLISRIKAILRRNSEVEDETENIVEIGDIKIIRSEYQAYIKNKPVTLPKKEFELLFFLAKHPGRVFSRETLLENIWGPDVYVIPRTVDVHIRKLREKLGEDYIQTIKGVGYKFVE